MKLDQDGYDFIANEESLRLKAYQDEGGVWTIGFGTIRYPGGAPVMQYDVCTVEEAKKWLNLDADDAAAEVSAALDRQMIKLPQLAFNMLTDFAYNEGLGHLLGSTLWKKICTNWKMLEIWKYAQDHEGKALPASCRLLDWVYVKHKVSNGLIGRRTREADNWRKAVQG